MYQGVPEFLVLVRPFNLTDDTDLSCHPVSVVLFFFIMFVQEPFTAVFIHS